MEASHAPNEPTLRAVAEAFAGRGTFVAAAPLGRGLIHGTWAIQVSSPGWPPELVVQRLNTGVFGPPEPLMENVFRTTEHLRARLIEEGADDVERRCLRLLRTQKGQLFHRDGAGAAWRAFARIEDAVTCERLASLAQAEEAARAFGAFARRMANLPGPPLHETLPRFHDFAARTAALDRAVAADSHSRAAGARAAIEALRGRSSEIRSALDTAGFARLPRRVVHHDCKLDNLLFDASGPEALCVIDLDTVMPGTLLSDFGELVRSCTNTAREDEPDPERVDFDRETYGALARGYRQGVGPLLGETERAALPMAGPLLALMNAVRFLTDHLEGDAYFRTFRPAHNLERARAQLRLAERMLEQRDALGEGLT